METTNVSMAAIGERLKVAREKRSVTIEQVQKQTRIHVTVLVALEEGRCDEILTPTYVKSFLKKYAQYLGLDSRDLLREYSIIHKDDSSSSSLPVTGEVKTGKSAGSFPPKILYVLFISAVAIVLVFAFLFLLQKLTAALKNIRISQPAKAASSKIIPPAKRKIVKEPVKKPVEVKEPDIKNIPPKKTPFNLVIRTKQTVLVKLKKDGVSQFDRPLPKGLSESFTADEKIELFIGKGEAVELILDGKFLGSPGKGVIKNLEITKNGIKK